MTVIQNPQLAGLLGPHFTPSAADATTFLQMYSTLVDIDNATGADLVFVLLTKVMYLLSLRINTSDIVRQTYM